MFKNKKILIIAAHPDDEILGCGATIARMTAEGAEAYTLILGEGITSRDDSRNAEIHKSELAELESHIYKANEIIGVRECFAAGLPDNRFDSLDLLDVVKIIEKYKNIIKPDIIFTHFENDLNIDHSVTARAVQTATRPMQGEIVKEIYAFEVLSSTEWRYPQSFSPNVFVDVSEYIEKKVEAMKVYTTELRDWPHPRSLEGIRTLAKSWGMKTGYESAEAFQLIRRIV